MITTRSLERITMALLTAALVISFLSRFQLLRYVSLMLPVLFGAVLVRAGWPRLARARVPVALVLLLAWITASYLWSADRGHTLRTLLDVATVSATALGAGLLLTLDQVRRAATWAIKCVVVLTGAVLVLAPGYSTRPPEGDPAPGWHSIFEHKNSLGGFLVLAFVTLCFDRSRWRPLWVLAVLVLLVGTQSSTALAVVLLSTSVLLWRAVQRRIGAAGLRSSFRVQSVIAVGLLAALTAAAPGLIAGLLGRSVTLTGRTEIWTAVERQIGLHPVLGLGWGGVWTPASAPTLAMWRESRFEAFYAHNGYLDVLLQIGVVGAALYAALVLSTLRRLAQHPDSDAAAWAAVVLLCFAVQALSESGPLTGGGAGVIFLIAVAAAQPRDGRPRFDQLRSGQQLYDQVVEGRRR